MILKKVLNSLMTLKISKILNILTDSIQILQGWENFILIIAKLADSIFIILFTDYIMILITAFVADASSRQNSL